jgi:hypothetical protein
MLPVPLIQDAPVRSRKHFYEALVVKGYGRMVRVNEASAVCGVGLVESVTHKSSRCFVTAVAGVPLITKEVFQRQARRKGTAPGQLPRKGHRGGRRIAA